MTDLSSTINVNDATSPIVGVTPHDVLSFSGEPGTTGYEVVIEETDGSFSGTVDILGQIGNPIHFSGIEDFAFETFINGGARNSDVVDATGVSSGLILNTGIGDDTVNFGTGDDTYKLPVRFFGTNVVDGNDGHDTLDLTALSGAQRRDLTFSGTNFNQTKASKVEINGQPADSVTFTKFETILSGGGSDTFTSGYAHEGLKSIDMGNGNDVFGWLTFAGDALDIFAGKGDDTVKIGGAVGSGFTGLTDGTVEGGIGQDTLNIGVTNGKFGATGFEVVIEDDATEANAFAGTVAYKGVADGPVADFSGFEKITFSTFKNAKNENDHVDATGATDLTLNTGIGNDTVDFGAGDDTFVISNRKFGSDVVDGGAGHDTLDLSAVTGAQRADFSFVGVGTFGNRHIPQQVFANETNNIEFANVEAIISGGGNDVFGGRVFGTETGAAFADARLKSIDMGAGNDVFAWNYTSGTLDIDGGRGKDTFKLGDLAGNGAVSLLKGTIDGGDAKDTLELGFVRHANGDGFKVIFDADVNGHTSGGVAYRDNETDAETVPGLIAEGEAFVGITQFESIEKLVFEGHTDDVVDISASRKNLTIDTGAGHDVIVSGNGGKDHLTGGAGADLFIFEQSGWFGKDKITDFDVHEDSLIGLQGVDAQDIKLLKDGETVQIRADNGILLLEGVTVDEVSSLFYGL